MALASCNVTTDKSQKELISHGITMFPIACYDDNLKSMTVPWHWHDEFEFIIMTEGTAQIHIENQVISLEQGNAIFINSAILHSIDRVQNNSCRCHSLVFHARLIGGSIESIFWQKLITPLMQNTSLRYLSLNQSIEWQDNIIKNMNKTWKIIAKETDDFENETRFYLSKAFHIMNVHLQSIPNVPNKQEQLNAERTKQMIRYMEEYYYEDISLDMIALSASISKSACLRCFKQIINTTPIRYLLQFRIEKAADAIKNTNERINEIAINCGFSDISYFSKCFRDLKGCTPLEFRKSSRKSGYE